MAQRKQTYAIRLAVEGGGQGKAELIAVGQSGEQSLKRIESAGERASGGLKGLGRQAELLRAGVRTLGGALLGVTTVGGLAALVDRSISAADAVGKTADKIGVGVEALQELRFAAKAAGIEQQTLDMALQRFTRRAHRAPATPRTRSRRWALRCATRAEPAPERGPPGRHRDSFARIEDPAARVRLALSVPGRQRDGEGVAIVITTAAAPKLPLEIHQSGVRRPAMLQERGVDAGPFPTGGTGRDDHVPLAQIIEPDRVAWWCVLVLFHPGRATASQAGEQERTAPV